MRISFQYNKDYKVRATSLRQSRNYAEVILWREIKGRKLCGLDFDRQKVIGNYIADFCCESARIIIEVDGSSHIGREEYDKERDEFLWACGFDVIRISDHDVKHNLDYVLKELSSRINKKLAHQKT